MEHTNTILAPSKVSGSPFLIIYSPTAAISGVMGTVAGLLVQNLGSIFNVSYAVTGSINSPVVGVFCTGMFVPWANSKVRVQSKVL